MSLQNSKEKEDKGGRLGLGEGSMIVFLELDLG